MGVLEAEQPPPDTVAITPITGKREHAEQCQQAHRPEEWRLIDLLQETDLGLIVRCGKVAAGVRRRKRGIEVLQAGLEVIGAVSKPGVERPVDEIHRARFARPGGGVGRDDLCGDRIDDALVLGQRQFLGAGRADERLGAVLEGACGADGPGGLLPHGRGRHARKCKSEDRV